MIRKNYKVQHNVVSFFFLIWKLIEIPENTANDTPKLCFKKKRTKTKQNWTDVLKRKLDTNQFQLNSNFYLFWNDLHISKWQFFSFKTVTSILSRLFLNWFRVKVIFSYEFWLEVFDRSKISVFADKSIHLSYIDMNITTKNLENFIKSRKFISILLYSSEFYNA